MKNKIIQEEKIFEFRGEYRVPQEGEWILSENGEVVQILCRASNFYSRRAIVHLVSTEKERKNKQVIFFQDGVSYYSEGEIRVPGYSDFYLAPSYKENNKC